MRADVLLDLRRRADDLRAGLRLAHGAERHQADCGSRTGNETGAAQERTAVENAGGETGSDALQTRPARGSFFSLHQHVRDPINSG